jgi:hypothetical protein
MFVHIGQHYYGKVDVVPDLCHVSTRFFHVNFVPLIPLESSIILAGTGVNGEPRTVKTSLSFKSVLTAWLRAVLYVVALGGLLLGILVTAEYFSRGGQVADSAVWGVWVVAAGAAFALVLTYRFNRASYDRTLRLAEELGLKPDEIDRLLASRGRPDRSAPEPEGWERYK